MSSSENIQQLRHDIQNELVTANQLLRLIANEVKYIKEFTAPENKLDANIKENTKLIARLANIHELDLTKLPPPTRTDPQSDFVHQSDQHMSNEQHDTSSSMDDSQ